MFSGLSHLIVKTNVFVLISFLTLFPSFALVSCRDNDGNSSQSQSDHKVGIVYDRAGKGDRSFNNSAYEGIKRAQKEFGVVIVEETTDGTENNREELIQSLAEENDLVIAVGFLFENSIKKVATENPDINFAGVDVPQRENAPENLASLIFNEAEASLLVGAAAAFKTESDKTGFIGGVCDTPDGIIEKFEVGFLAGVQLIANLLGKTITVRTEYLSQYSDIHPVTGEGDISGFNDPAKAKEAARKMFEAGSDVVFHASGGSGAGLFEAAKEFSLEEGNSKVWAIGVDSDQYQTAEESVREYILTSMLKRVDTAVYNIIKIQSEGKFQGGNVINKLSNDGVGYATSGGFIDNIIDLIEAIKVFVVRDLVTPLPTESAHSCREPQIYELQRMVMH